MRPPHVTSKRRNSGDRRNPQAYVFARQDVGQSSAAARDGRIFGQSIRVDSMIQFVSHASPMSGEKACSQRAEVGVISDQM